VGAADDPPAHAAHDPLRDDPHAQLPRRLRAGPRRARRRAHRPHAAARRRREPRLACGLGGAVRRHPRRRYYDEGLRYHAGVKTPVRCLGLIDQYGVTFEGALLPCCVWGGDGLAVGNVFETPLSTLWRSPEVQARRGSLFAEGCTVGCFNHSLYEFTRSTGLGFRVPSTP
jgi:MoaA/NifB/PqqE/SkfB family radical SAM enzyme